MFLTSLIFALTATALWAAPERYRLDQSKSRVGFTYLLQGAETKGQMPVSRADILLDLDRISQSSVSVSINAAKARAGLIFATEAMRGASILNRSEHPEITFQSTSVRGTVNAAKLTGNLTLRGVTRPVVLDAKLLRQEGTEIGERDRLAIRLTGALDRNAFGADGWPGLVDPTITLDILAFINRVR